MDQRDFDHLARNLSQTANRRNAFRAIMAAAAGALVGWLPGARPAAAAPDCCPTSYPNRCGRTCYNLNNDIKNCGECGKICPIPTNVCKVRRCRNRQCGEANKANGSSCPGTNPCKTYSCVNGTCTAGANKSDGTRCAAENGLNSVCVNGTCPDTCPIGYQLCQSNFTCEITCP